MAGNQRTAETGAFEGAHRYVKVGAGGMPLVVLPGLVLDNEDPGAWTARAYAFGFGRLAADRAVFIVQRRRGLPAGAATPDIAADYADVLRRQLGRIDLMGMSTGGLIAQHVALENPDLVRRLVLVVTGARLSEQGKAICTDWRRLAEAGRWRDLRGELAAAAVDGAVGRRLARGYQALFGPRADPSPVAANDFLTTVDADLAHDTRTRLSELRAPTLVTGGAADPFFPEPILTETAAAIPNARLTVYANAGHGMPKRHARKLQDDARAFLGIP